MARSIFAHLTLIGLVLEFALPSAPAQEPTITTVVGGGFSSLDNSPTGFAVGNVTAVAVGVDSQGNLKSLYIADSTHGSVYKVDAITGVPTVVAGNGADGNTPPLAYPSGIAVDANGNLFIADSVLNVVYKVPTSGRAPNIVAGCGPTSSPCQSTVGDGGPATSAQLAPHGIAVDSAGNLFIADWGTSSVREVCASSAGPCGGAGHITTVAGGLSQAGVALDSAGNLFIADGTSSVLEVCASSAGPCGGAGHTTTVAGCGQSDSLAVDSSGILYFADPGANAVWMVNPPGQCEAAPGTTPRNYVFLKGPVAVAVGGGLLFIADAGNFVVRAVNVSNPYHVVQFGAFSIGLVETVAGNGSAHLIPEGSDPHSFQLVKPSAVSEDAASNIYLCETPPRVLEATPFAIEAVAGTGTSGVPNSGDGGPALSAQLQDPKGLFLDSADNVFIADSFAGIEEVQKASGVILPIVKNYVIGNLAGVNANDMYFTAAPFYVYGQSAPESISSVFNTSNSSFQLNPSGRTILRAYPATSAELGDNGPATAATFNVLSGLCLDSGGNLYITDSGDQLVRVVNTGSTAIKVAGVNVPPGFINTIAGGGGVRSDGDHSYYKATEIGDGGPATNAYIAPAGCFVDNLGNIFIADENNDRIRRVDRSTGIITTVAGGQYPGFSGDGKEASSAQLNLPNAIWGDQAGNLLISDSGNHLIREISGLLPVPSASLSCDNCDLTNIPGSSTTGVVTLTNTGNAPLVMSTGPTLTDSKDFTISASTCPVGAPGLAPQLFCKVSVTANGTLPAGATVANANLVFHDNAYLSNTNGPSGPTPDPANLGQLSGYLQPAGITFTSYSPTANFDPLSLVFTAENVAQPIRVKNTGSVVLNVNSVTVQAPFAFQTNPPSDSCSNSGAAFSVQPASTCNIYVVFRPPSSGGAGVANPVVTIVDNAVVSTQIIPLLGYALVPSGATSLSISNGAPAPVNATFSLVGIPSSANVTPVCLITPAGLDVNCTYNGTNQSISATVSIPSCVQTSQANVPAHGPGTRYLPIAAAAIALLLPWGRSSRRRLLALLTFALLSYVVSGLSACTSTNTVSSSCVASVPAGTKFNLSVTAIPTTADQFPSLTLTTPDIINVTQ